MTISILIPTRLDILTINEYFTSKFESQAWECSFNGLLMRWRYAKSQSRFSFVSYRAATAFCYFISINGELWLRVMFVGIRSLVCMRYPCHINRYYTYLTSIYAKLLHLKISYKNDHKPIWVRYMYTHYFHTNSWR